MISCYDTCYTCYVMIPVLIPVFLLRLLIVCNTDITRLDYGNMKRGYIDEGFLVWIIPSMY